MRLTPSVCLLIFILSSCGGQHDGRQQSISAQNAREGATNAPAMQGAITKVEAVICNEKQEMLPQPRNKAEDFSLQLLQHLIKHSGHVLSGKRTSNRVCLIIDKQDKTSPNILVTKLGYTDTLNAAITINSRAIEILRREELAAVLAHEWHHLTFEHRPGILPSTDQDPWHNDFLKIVQEIEILSTRSAMSIQEIGNSYEQASNALIAAFNASSLPQQTGWKLDRERMDVDWNEEEGLTLTRVIREKGDANTKQALDRFLDIGSVVGFKMIGKFPAALNEKIMNIERQQALVLPREVIANETEAQADVAGVQTLLRAGFSLTHFVGMMETMDKHANQGKTTVPECQSRLSSDPNFIPDRGTETHPEVCWRIWNVSKVAKGLTIDAKVKFQSRVSFEDVRAELRAP